MTLHVEAWGNAETPRIVYLHGVSGHGSHARRLAEGWLGREAAATETTSHLKSPDREALPHRSKHRWSVRGGLLTSAFAARNHAGMGTATSVHTSGLLERAEALASLAEALNETRLGRGRVVLVGGEAGVGKTALVNAFCSRVGARSRVLVGACDPLSTPRPLGPLHDVAADCSVLGAALATDAQPFEIFTALREELADQPTVLVLEDVHWGDEATFDVLRLLARRIDVPALVLVTYRDDGLHRDHPLRVLAGDLATVGAVERLVLAPLSLEAVTELAAGHEVDPMGLYERTAGNPFFVEQALAAGGPGVPPTVRDAVLARAAGLSRTALGVLETVALALPRAESWLLDAVAGDAVAHLDDCVATGLISWDVESVGFRHEIARLAIESQMPPTRRIAVQRQILAALRSITGDEVDLARLAHHAEAARDVDAVLELAPAAAERASSAGAYREAASQYARALRAGEAFLSPKRRAELLEGRSRASYLADDQVEAIAVIRDAIACRREAKALAHEARDLAELSSYLVCRGLLQEAREAMATATRLIEGQDESAEIAFVDRYRAVIAWIDGDRPKAVELGWRARELALRMDAPRTAVDALITVGTIELGRDPERGRALVEQAIAEARVAGFSEQVARGLNDLGASVTAPEVADAYLQQALDYCVEHNEDLWRINVLALSARRALDRGRWTEAANLAERLLQDPRESPWPHAEALLVLALVRARRGDPGASTAVAEAEAVGVPADELEAHVDLAAARAEIAWLEQRPHGVAAATDELLRVVTARGDHAAATRLAFWRRLAGLESDTSTTVTGDAYSLAVTGDWAAAAALWKRSSVPYEAALALLETSDEDSFRSALEAFNALGARPAGQIARRRLQAIGARGVARGPRQTTRQNAAGLTPRECEVLALVAVGHRNAEIADRLFVSRRTVDYHISSLLRKLDASTRVEAVAAARQLGVLQDR